MVKVKKHISPKSKKKSQYSTMLFIFRAKKKSCHLNGIWAKNILGRKLGNPYFCRIVGMERPIFFKTEIALNENLSMCKET